MSSFITATQADKYLFVRVAFPEQSAITQQTRALHLALLLDVSGSMDGPRLRSVKRTIHAIRSLLNPADRITVVCFGSRAEAIFVSYPVNTPEQIDAFYNKIDQISTNGCTNMEAGMNLLRDKIPATDPYDGVMILTDGEVNEGIVSVDGLYSLARSICGSRALPLYCLGYGEDHNRLLLRRMSLKSRGSYTYIDAEATLPLAMGNILGELRMEYARDAVIVAPGWTCMELDHDGEGRYRMGSLIPGRDYWAVFWRGPAAMTDSVELQYTTMRGNRVEGRHTLFTTVKKTRNYQELMEQMMRARVAYFLNGVSDMAEGGKGGKAITEERDALKGKATKLLEHLGRFKQDRPMIIKLKAQVLDAVETLNKPVIDRAAAARVSSGAAILSTQRGGAHDRSFNLFSSPAQRVISNQTQQNYDEDEAHVD